MLAYIISSCSVPRFVELSFYGNWFLEFQICCCNCFSALFPSPHVTLKCDGEMAKGVSTEKSCLLKENYNFQVIVWTGRLGVKGLNILQFKLL